MVDERTAYWGERDAARYRTQDDDPTGGDYVVAETLDANGDPVDVLLRWDDTAGEWVSGGPVNMDGSDVTNVGALDADSVSTDDLITNLTNPDDSIATHLSSINDLIDKTVFVEDVSTTKTTLFKIDQTNSDQDSVLSIVSGVDKNGNRFYDLVFVGAAGNGTTVASDDAGSPSGRTYTKDGPSGSRLFSLEMASGTYDVRCRFWHLGGHTFD